MNINMFLSPLDTYEMIKKKMCITVYSTFVVGNETVM